MVPQLFWPFPVTASNSTSLQRLRQKIFSNQVVPILRFTDTAALCLQEEKKISRREQTSLVESLRNILKTFDHARSVNRFPYRNPKLRLDRRSQKTTSLLNTITISLKIQIHRFVYRSVLETTILASFPSKRLIYTAIILFCHKLSPLTIANSTIFKRTNITLQTKVNWLRAKTMCCAFTSECGDDNGTFILIGGVFIRIKTVRVNFVWTNRLHFSFSCQKRLSMSAMQICEPSAQYSLWKSNKIFFLVVWPRGWLFWRESKISSRCYWRCLLSSQVLLQQRKVRNSWRLCNNSEIRLWLGRV